MGFNNLLARLMRHFRTARAHRIKALFPDIGEMEVVDLGGSLHFWDVVGAVLAPRSLRVLNIVHDGASLGDRLDERSRVLLYDGKRVPYDDKSVDLLICNSVIEHVPLSERPGLAREIERVARNWIVQTPAKIFPIEPHFYMPGFHWLPRKWGRCLAPITVGARFGEWTWDAREYFDEIQLLTRRELAWLFPSATIEAERVAGWPKSYLAYHRD